MNLTFSKFDLRLKHTFQISRESRDVQTVVIVFLSDEDGTFGIGEASPSSFFGESPQSVIKVLNQSVDLLKKADPFHREDITSDLKRIFPKDAAARAALDIALHDLVAKKLHTPLYGLFGLNHKHTKPTSFTIGIDTIENMCSKAEEVKDFPILKVKVGIEHDIEILQELRKATKAVFRVDANTGWTEDEAIRKIRLMEKLGVELVEQPFPVKSLDSLKRIKKQVKIPVFADEDLVDSKDIPRLSEAVDGINIKLMKCGGVLEALRIIHTARAHGLKIMIGCNIESSVSITAAAHLMPLVDYIDLDGNLLVTNDPYKGVTVKHGHLILPKENGLGIQKRDYHAK